MEETTMFSKTVFHFLPHHSKTTFLGDRLNQIYKKFYARRRWAVTLQDLKPSSKGAQNHDLAIRKTIALSHEVTLRRREMGEGMDPLDPRYPCPLDVYFNG
jgi:hypothetical protein